jgi:hypothetical protein
MAAQQNVHVNHIPVSVALQTHILETAQIQQLKNAPALLDSFSTVICALIAQILDIGVCRGRGIVVLNVVLISIGYQIVQISKILFVACVHFALQESMRS